MNINVAKQKKSHAVQIKFLFNVHLDSMKYPGKRNGVRTVVNKPITAPEEVKNAES